MVCKALLAQQGLERLWLRAETPWMTLADRNISYIAIDGHDPQLDAQHLHPEHILLRIFVAATRDSLTAENVTVYGTVSRESLDHPPHWGHDGNPDHFYTCLSHKWTPQFVLR